MSAFLTDIRLTIRTLAHHPGFTTLAVLSLALGIGATTAMLTAVNTVLLRPLPYAAADRLVAIQENVPRLASISTALPVTAYDFLQWRERSRAFDGFALVTGTGAVLTSRGAPQRLSMGRISASLFSMLGIQPEMGRTFVDADEQPGHDRVVVLSHALWAAAFAADPAIVGQTIQLGRTSYEVIGVLPAGTEVPRQSQLETIALGDVPADLWAPFVVRQDDLVRMSEFDYGCIGRMKPGVTPAQARADLEAIEYDIARSAGADAELHAIVTPLQAQATARSKGTLLILFGACGIVLVIVCVNVSNLLLSRSIGRRREFAIRAAVGASRSRLVRQTLTESATIASAGSMAGLMFADWALRAVLAGGSLDLPHLRELRLDLSAWGFAAALTLTAAMLVGVLPAWRSARTDPQEALTSGGRSVIGDRRGRLRHLLISAEIALCTVSLVIAGLLLNSFVRLTHVDAGFAADRALAASISVPAQSDAAGIAFVRTLIERIQAVPGVVAAGVSNRLPLSGEGSNLGINVENGALAANEWPTSDYRCISPGYFRAMGIPLVAGRLIRESDGQHLVGLVSAGTARRLWPGASPVGKHFKLGGDGAPAIEVVGIVGDVHGVSLQKQPNLTVYVPYWQRFRSQIALAVRAAGDPATVASAIRAEVHALTPGAPPPRIVTGAEIVAESFASRRFQLELVLFFGIAALFLAAVGVYGVVSQSIARRTQEIGVRMALGASRTDVWRLVAHEGLTPVLGGLAVGLAGSILVARLVQAFLFEVRPSDPQTLLGVSIVLVAAALCACYVPGMRAARLDPLDALRIE